jgi:hypothetical protein
MFKDSVDTKGAISAKGRTGKGLIKAVLKLGIKLECLIFVIFIIC